jgi:hypothetical protein
MLDMQRQIEDLLAYVREDIAEPAPRGRREKSEALVRAAASQRRAPEPF